MLIKLASKLRNKWASFRIEKINRSKVSTLGHDSALNGFIDKRTPKSSIEIGNDCLISGMLVTETDNSRIKIGNNVFLGGGSTIDCAISVTIEDDVLVSYGCILSDSDNHSLRYSIRKKDLADWKEGCKHDWSTTISKPLLISKGAWIGAGAIILKGVTIGEGAVIGAGSVVTKDIPPYSIAAGNPARVIREIPLNER